MDVSAPGILLGFLAVMCVVGVAWGSRRISRRSDAVLEATRQALRSRHAVPPPVASAATPGPATPGPATPGSATPGPALSWSAQLDADAIVDPPFPAHDIEAAHDGPDASDDLESTGRHRVPEELMRASTYLLTPDRIARAKVRQDG